MTNMIKTITSIILISVLALSMTGCIVKPENAEAETTSATETTIVEEITVPSVTTVPEEKIECFFAFG